MTGTKQSTIDNETLVLMALIRAAQNGEVTPTDEELGELVGIKRASYYLKRLKQDGRIAVRNGRTSGRVVTITASQISTLPRPHFGGKEIVRKRKKPSQNKATERKCLRCGKQFASVHAPSVHRICGSCVTTIKAHRILDGAFNIPIGDGGHWRRAAGKS